MVDTQAADIMILVGEESTLTSAVFSYKMNVVYVLEHKVVKVLVLTEALGSRVTTCHTI